MKKITVEYFCPKCGHNDLCIDYKDEGDILIEGYSNKHSLYYEKKAENECLFMICRRCHYQWIEDILRFKNANI